MKKALTLQNSGIALGSQIARCSSPVLAFVFSKVAKIGSKSRYGCNRTAEVRGSIPLGSTRNTPLLRLIFSA